MLKQWRSLLVTKEIEIRFKGGYRELLIALKVERMHQYVIELLEKPKVYSNLLYMHI